MPIVRLTLGPLASYHATHKSILSLPSYRSQSTPVPITTDGRYEEYEVRVDTKGQHGVPQRKRHAPNNFLGEDDANEGVEVHDGSVDDGLDEFRELQGLIYGNRDLHKDLNEGGDGSGIANTHG
eukprot:CAMPEP_0118647874 /NCGR_PEP_ID=MMETSP0785-20121206/8846_1 /TAXON_ID=91992 /ORGANISM="Bolidomonas pacifica, Strain CCMP 1866" /LENGTH=123 /DNA_ID=CAMNT_0006540011 /DNA_START=208 /DNA_END=575 /DNA_ORIENTATION=+